MDMDMTALTQQQKGDNARQHAIDTSFFAVFIHELGGSLGFEGAARGGGVGDGYSPWGGHPANFRPLLSKVASSSSSSSYFSRR